MTSANSWPFHAWIFHDAGTRTPPPSSKKYTSALFSRTGDGHCSCTHWVPCCGQVPQRGLAPSSERGGSMPSLTAATFSHGEV